MALHTALRKCCDSTPTSLAWNLINIDEASKAWGEYLDKVWLRIEALEQKPEVFGSLLKAAAGDLEWGSNARERTSI